MPRKTNKYGAIKTRIDGILFDSRLEAGRYSELKLLERAREISNIEVHPSFPIFIKGQRICVVELDFAYDDRDGNRIFEDTKGLDTALSKIKRKLVSASYGINVNLVKR